MCPGLYGLNLNLYHTWGKLRFCCSLHSFSNLIFFKSVSFGNIHSAVTSFLSDVRKPEDGVEFMYAAQLISFFHLQLFCITGYSADSRWQERVKRKIQNKKIIQLFIFIFPCFLFLLFCMSVQEIIVFNRLYLFFYKKKLTFILMFLYSFVHSSNYALHNVTSLQKKHRNYSPQNIFFHNCFPRIYRAK